MWFRCCAVMFLAGSLSCRAEGALPASQLLNSQAGKYLASGSADGSGVRLLTAACLRNGSNREYPYPAKGHQLVVNPPVFTWPMSDYEYAETFPNKPELRDLELYDRYGFQLSRSPDFPEAATRTATGLRLPFFHPHSKMEPGVWFWRYRVEKAGAAAESWSKTFEMMVDSSVPVLESPGVDKAYGMLPAQFPRVNGAYFGLKETEWNRGQLAEIRQLAQKALKKESADYVTKGESIPTNATPQEIQQIEKFRLSYEVTALCEAVESLMKAYALDGKPEYLNKALSLSDDLLSRDPAKIFVDADFSGSAIMATLATVYDMYAWKLPEEQRSRYEKTIGDTLALILSQQMEENIGAADGILSEHFFQHVFLDAFKATISLHDRLPHGKDWFGMLYEIWLARTPGGGFMDDGAWPNGNQGYMQVNMESMVQNYLFYRDLFGVNLFEHPWYRNCGLALIYTVPPGSAGDGFGDGSEKTDPPNSLRADFAYILGRETGNPYAIQYAYTAKNLRAGQPYQFEKKSFRSYRLQHVSETPVTAPLSDLPQAAVFPETGIASMHTALADPDKNIFLSFRSSPFGVGSHGHADQNAFNLIVGGESMFYSTGYRVTTQDKHYLANQKHSRSKNTITVDGKTQAYGDNGYGWIGRYLHGGQFSYAMGDASRAYQPFPRGSINWVTVCKTAGIYTSDQGFILNEQDDPQVKLFRRHIAMLRPSTVLIYDELEAAKPVSWEWHLNGRGNITMTADTTNLQVMADGGKADGQTTIFASTKLQMNLLSGYYVKPVDWLNPQRGRKATEFDAVQYHSTTENAVKTRAMRYFAVIQIDQTNQKNFQAVKPDTNGVYAVNGYRIKAELDMEKTARLEVLDPATGAHLLYGEGQEGFAGRKYSRSTVLFEKATGLQESADTWPLMVPPAAE